MRTMERHDRANHFGGLVSLLLLSLLPGLDARGPGQDRTASAHRSQVIAAAQQIMRDARYCALITVGQDGHPQSRVVDPIAPAEDLTVWIGTNPITRKVAQIRKDARVTLHYFDPQGPGYVTMLGKAELIDDPAEKASHWKQDWAPFYKDGSRGDDFILIRVEPLRLEVVSDSHGLLNDPTTWIPAAVDFP